MNPLPFMLTVATTLLIMASVVWMLRKLSVRRAAGRATFMASAPVGGMMDVPVRSTYSRGGLLGGEAHNSLGPELTIAGDGIHFRVLRRGILPFNEVEHVDLRKTLFGLVLIFTSGNGRRLLAADVGDVGVAQRVLAALPRLIPLTEDAATARDGNPTAATPLLRRYRGPLS